MIIRPILHGTADYEAECALRHMVLRVPLGLDLYAENLAAERNQMHFGLFGENEDLLACAIAVLAEPPEARIRQMAVRPDRQRQGLGRILIQALEETLVGRGFLRFHLHARLGAAGFYETLGYTRIGSEFTEVGIPHVMMEKTVGGKERSRRDTGM